MRDYNIIQVIPVNSEMYAVYKEDIKNKIVCLALIEYEDGDREVVPMDITDGDGSIGVLCDNLKYIEHV